MKGGFLGVGAVGLLLSFFAACRTVPPSPLAQTPANERQVLETFAQEYVDDGHAGVLIAAIFPDGHEVVVVRGVADVTNQTNVLSERSIFRIGSLTKNLVFLLVETLAREGKINLNQSVLDALGPDANLPASYAGVTLKDLLWHQSGLPRESYPWYRIMPLLGGLFSDDHVYADFDTREGLLATLRRRECAQAVANPTICYSNLGYGLIGLILEAQTGQSLPELMAKYVTKPLGLTDTAFTLTPEQRTRLVGAHSGDVPFFWLSNRPVRAYELGEAMRATGGLYSSGRDQLACLRLYRKMILARDKKEPFNAETDTVVHMSHYFRLSPSGHRQILRYGMTYGSASFLGFDLDNQIAVLILRNNCDWPDDLGEDLLDLLDFLDDI